MHGSPARRHRRQASLPWTMHFIFCFRQFTMTEHQHLGADQNPQFHRNRQFVYPPQALGAFSATELSGVTRVAPWPNSSLEVIPAPKCDADAQKGSVSTGLCRCPSVRRMARTLTDCGGLQRRKARQRQRDRKLPWFYRAVLLQLVYGVDLNTRTRSQSRAGLYRLVCLRD
jgi:hypothetical protein